MVACSRSEQQFAIDRLYDRAGGNFSLTADQTWRPTLDPSVAEYRFSITTAERGARLLVFPGIDSKSPASRILFEVTWQHGAEPPATIYRRELREPGWAEEVIELPTAGPGELRLRKNALARPERAALRSGWGDPTILSGSVPARPSVILISLDTLRADRLGVYGRREARTPALDAFARSAVLYDYAYSPSTWTVPSHQSMLYGIQAATLPGTKPGGGSPEDWQFTGFASLADAFRNAGYLTAAFTGGGFVDRGYGMGRGFDSYFSYRAAAVEPGTCDESRFDGTEVFHRAIRWLHARRGVPFFLFVHTYDAHDRCPVLPLSHKADKDFTAQDRDALIRYYDEVVARADGLVATLLRELDALGLADSTLVAITSDHGEGLWEHGFWGHGCGAPAYEELSHIPLVLRLPRSLRRTDRIDMPVSIVDLAPTLLALVGIPIPRTMQGGMLPGLGLPAEPARPIYVLCGDWLSVRKGDLKFMLSREAKKRMLFNTRNDREERIDLVKQASADKDELRALARSYWPRHRRDAQLESASQPAPTLAPADAERLRVLGYSE